MRLQTLIESSIALLEMAYDYSHKHSVSRERILRAKRQIAYIEANIYKRIAALELAEQRLRKIEALPKGCGVSKSPDGKLWEFVIDGHHHRPGKAAPWEAIP